MTLNATQPDGSSPPIPISSAVSPGNKTPVGVQGAPGAFVDVNNNPTTAVVTSFIQPRIVQKGNNVTGSAGKTLAFTFANNTTNGNSIVVVLGMGEVEGANITLAVTDSQGNTYSKAGGGATQSTTLEAAIFYATNISAGVGTQGGANTVTITIAGTSSVNTAIATEVYEVHGLIALAGALDQTAAGNSAGSTSVATASASPIAPNEIAFVAIAAAGGTITAGTNWALDSGSLAPTGGNLVSFGSESQALTTAAALTGTATLSASNAWAATIATFKTIMLPIAGTFNPQTSGTGTPTSVAGIASAVALLVNNPARKGAYIYNDSSATLYVGLFAHASLTTSLYTTQVPPNNLYELPTIPAYTGEISGIWSSATGNARCTEMS